MISVLIGILLAIHVVVCILLVFIVLMQRPRSEGLGTAFGGAVTDTLFGSGAGNVLTNITKWLGTIFFITTLSLAYLYSHREPPSKLGQKLQNASMPQAAPLSTNALPAAPKLPAGPAEQPISAAPPAGK